MVSLKPVRHVRNTVRTAIRKNSLGRGIRQMMVFNDKPPAHRLIKQAWAGWGNQSYSGHPDYLEEVIRWAITTNEPVLECGSGLTTLLLGIYAARRGVQVWTLEHDLEWLKQTKSALKEFRIDGVELTYAPLKSYGDYSWYDPPFARLPSKFGLVVCDGPPQKSTPGDRYGLLPLMRDRLGAGSVVLLDDIRVPGADPVLSRWLREISASCKSSLRGPSNSYAVMTLL